MLFISNASAQTEDNTRYFRCLAWNQDVSGLFFTQSELPDPPSAENPNPAPNPDYKEQQLSIPGALRSRIYSYQPDKPVKIIRHVQDKTILVATLDMHAAPRLALLFFIPSPKTMDVRVIDDGVDTFPGGGVEVFNYSHLAPKFVIETTSGNQSVQIPLSCETNTTARISVWVSGKSTPTFSTAWDMFNSIRYMAFVVDDPNDKSNVTYTRVPDNITNLKMNLERLEQSKN
jgi:hypothetical protein